MSNAPAPDAWPGRPTLTESGSAPGAAEQRVTLLIRLDDGPGALESALRPFARRGVNLTRIESRPRRGGTFDFYVDCEGHRDDPTIARAIDELSRTTARATVLGDRHVPWFPRHIAELDVVAANTLDAGGALHTDHPAFSDAGYRRRRADIARLAQDYRYGASFPVIEYTAAETETWGRVYRRLAPLRTRYGCGAYLAALDELERHCDFGPGSIPQGRHVSAFLEARTGFVLRPVAGLLRPRDFLNGLAFRVFFSAQYVRHHSVPFYTPEPDVCHELLGHAPMFADPAFAELSQEIGLASLGASDDDIERLARCYWYSVEFGLLREDGQRKAYGAGVLSSVSELERACGDGLPDEAFKPWDPEAAAHEPHPITDLQPRYLVADSLRGARTQLQEFCASLSRPFHARYDAARQRVWVDRAIRRRAVTGAKAPPARPSRTSRSRQ